MKQATIVATKDGFVEDIDALVVGHVAVGLGAGRMAADEPVNPKAGIWFHKKVGCPVKEGEAVATLHTDKDTSILEDAIQRIAEAIRYSSSPVSKPPVLTHMVSTSAFNGTEEFIMPEHLQ